MYNKIPKDIKPSQNVAKVTFVGAFDPMFSMILRERRLDTLLIMQDDAIDVEGNRRALGKINPNMEKKDKEEKVKEKDKEK